MSTLRTNKNLPFSAMQMTSEHMSLSKTGSGLSSLKTHNRSISAQQAFIQHQVLTLKSTQQVSRDYFMLKQAFVGKLKLLSYLDTQRWRRLCT